MIVWDKETDNLLDKVTTIHCLVVIDRDTKMVEAYFDDKNVNKTTIVRAGNIRAGLHRVESADVIGGHNVHAYDIPVGQKLYPGQFYPKGIVRDSFTESEMWYPANDLRSKDFKADRKFGSWIPSYMWGRHSLEAWGMRLKQPKDDYSKRMKEKGLDPWAEFNHDMLVYCIQDVHTNIKLFDFLESHFDYRNSSKAVMLENLVAPILARQEQYGVAFNVQGGGVLHGTLIKRHGDISRELREYFGDFLSRNGKAVYPKKSMRRWIENEHGTVTRKVKGVEQRGYYLEVTEDAPYVKIKLIPFNPASRQHIWKRLMAVYGWKPTKFTEKGEPTVDETVIGELTYPPAKLLNEYLLLDKRLGQLVEGKQAWLRKEKNGRIHGRVKANGTRTTRCSHVNPNLGQVPKVKKRDGKVLMGAEGGYGADCRALFGPGAGRVQMGCDLSGIELRAEAHYLARWDGGEMANEVIDGDVHEKTRIVLGMQSRDNQKTFRYAMTYGAFPFKLGGIIYDDFTDEQKTEFGKPTKAKITKLGKERTALLSANVKGYSELHEAIEKSYNKGWLTALDGRHLSVPSLHSALNTLYQGFGGNVAKAWLVLFDKLLVENGLIPANTWYIDPNQMSSWKVIQILMIHDELQTSCESTMYAERAGELAIQAANLVQGYFNLNVRIDAEMKIGKNWMETH